MSEIALLKEAVKNQKLYLNYLREKLADAQKKVKTKRQERTGQPYHQQ